LKSFLRVVLKFDFWPQYLIREHHKIYFHIVRAVSHTIPLKKLF